MARQSASTARHATIGIAAAAMLAATSLANLARADAPGKSAAPRIEGLPAQCLKAGDELAKLKCGRAVFQKRAADANARSAASDERTADNKSAKSCFDALIDEVNSAKKAAPLTPDQKIAFKMRAASCEKS